MSKVTFTTSKIDSAASPIKLHFADGTVVFFNAKAGFDFVFEATFLKYCTICIVIFGMLHRRPVYELLSTAELIALWVTILVAAIAWFFLVVSAILLLRKVLSISSIYTPLVTLPCVVLNEAVALLFVDYIVPADVNIVRFEMTSMIQATIAVLLFDILFGNYVASHHSALQIDDEKANGPPRGHIGADPMMDGVPTIRVANSERAEAVAPSRAIVDVGATVDDPVQNKRVIELAGRHIDPASLIAMQIEGHYLRIQTAQQSRFERCKLCDAVQAVGPDIGIQVNRSTWVAASQLAVLTRKGPNRASVILKTGEEYTISRSRMAAVSTLCKSLRVEIR